MKFCSISAFLIIGIIGLTSATVPSPLSPQRQLLLSPKNTGKVSRGGGGIDAHRSGALYTEGTPYSNASVEAFLGNLQLFAAGALVWWATKSVPFYFVKQSEFTSKFFQQCGKTSDIATFVNAIWPDTLSRGICIQNELTGVMIGALYSVGALFLMNGRLGMPSIFPTRVRPPEALFHFFRWLCPFISLWLVPKIPIQITDDFDSAGKAYQAQIHSHLAFPAFFLSPVLEVIQSVRTLRKHAREEKSAYQATDEEKSKLNRAMWLGFTLIKTFFAVGTLYTCLRFSLSQQDKYKSGPLGNVQGYILETCMIMNLGAVFVFLALAQLCECATGDIARFSWVYMIPFTYFGAVVMKTTLGKSFMAFDINKNYLEILGLKELMNAVSGCADISNSIDDSAGTCCLKAYKEYGLSYQ